MSESLKVDVDELHTLSTSLRRAEIDLSNSDYFSFRVADAVGHDGLAARCREFSTGWNDNREKVLERVAGMSMSIRKIADAFAQLETNLARGIASEDSGSSGRGSSGEGGR
jgi:hypothetical protein